MNILVNGTSISRGNQSWPYYLQSLIGTAEIVNLAQAGSGNSYIQETTLEEAAKRPYDLVLVQWTYADRLDFRVKDISKFNDSQYTSEYQSQQNDWPSKKIHPVNDQDYVQKNWIFGCGYINEQKNDSIGRVFKEYYAVTGLGEQMNATLVKIIGLQNTLKALGVPYLFIEYRPMTRFDRFEHLYNLIDWSNFASSKHLFEIARERNELDDTLHPSLVCQSLYAEELYKELVTRKLVNG